MEVAPEQRFLINMMRAGRAWRRIADVVAADYELTEATALPLLFLDRMEEGPRQADLAEAMGIERPSVVWLMDQLCRLKLVRRTGDLADKRARRIFLTDKGRTVTMEIQQALEEQRKLLFAFVEPDDLQSAIRVFEALERANREHFGRDKDDEDGH